MSSSFEQTRQEIIEMSYSHLGMLGEGQVLSAERMQFAINVFNAMIKRYQAKGLHLWAEEEGYVFLDKSQPNYYLGSRYSSPAKACYREDAVITTLSANVAAAGTSVTVGTTTGMTIGDYIGIVQNDLTVFWTTIATIPTSTTLTLTAGITSASSTGKNVYTFTTLIDKPLRMYSARRISFSSTVSAQALPMLKLSHEEFFDLPYKNMTGTPTHWYYQPRKTYGQLHMWPATDTGMTYLEVTFDRPLEDLSTVSTVPDFPQEWVEPLAFQLAIRLAPRYGKEDKVAKLIVPLGADVLQEALSWDSEDASISFQPRMYN